MPAAPLSVRLSDSNRQFDGTTEPNEEIRPPVHSPHTRDMLVNSEFCRASSPDWLDTKPHGGRRPVAGCCHL